MFSVRSTGAPVLVTFLQSAPWDLTPVTLCAVNALCASLSPWPTTRRAISAHPWTPAWWLVGWWLRHRCPWSRQRHNLVSQPCIPLFPSVSQQIKVAFWRKKIKSNLSQRSPALNGHLCYVASLFLSLCSTFPIKESVLNGHLSYTATNFWSPGWPHKTDLTVILTKLQVTTLVFLGWAVITGVRITAR
jgi:hypothetical protein